MTMAAAPRSPLSPLRTWFDRIERSELPGAVKSIAKFARRLVRRGLMPVRRAVRALHPKMLKRNLLFPLRNFVLGGKPLRVEVADASYLLVPAGAVPLEMWSGFSFERHELEFILSVLKPGMTLIDVGANVGMFSVPGAKKVANGTVLAFEPSRWTHARLCENLKINGVTNVKALRYALGDHTGEVTLQLNARGKDGLNTIGRPAHPDSQIVSSEKVQLTTLDECLRQEGIRSAEVMKVDAEGAELFIFRGARDLLSRSDAPLILYESCLLTEGFDYHPVEQMWLLQKHGYELFLLDSQSGRISHAREGRAYDSNVIAVKPTHPAYQDITRRAS